MGEESKIYVGNMSYDMTEEDLRNNFCEFGSIDEAIVIKDRDTGRSKGIGFVAYKDQVSAEKAIEKMNQASIMGREVTVNMATARSSRDRGGRGGGYGGRSHGYGDNRGYDDRNHGSRGYGSNRGYGNDGNQGYNDGGS